MSHQIGHIFTPAMLKTLLVQDFTCIEANSATFWLDISHRTQGTLLPYLFTQLQQELQQDYAQLSIVSRLPVPI